MTQDERRGWLHSAYKALGDVSGPRLEIAVREAMQTVDHPSKIVPAIRKALEGYYKPARITISPPAIGDGKPHHDGEADAERDEVAAMMKKLADNLRSKGH